MSETGALVALRDRREAVIQILSDSFASDLIDVELFDGRLARAHAATTVAELDALVADLAPLPASAPRVALERTPTAGSPGPRAVSAVFANIERRGGWQVPNQVRARSVFGNLELDFREARLVAGVTELRVRAVFGNIEIVVPPHLAVECEGSAVFGNFEHGENAVADPGRPLLRVVGTAVFGNIEIKTRLPGETEGDARRRRKRERASIAAPPMLPALPAKKEDAESHSGLSASSARDPSGN
jgi:hypothetical protein